MTPIPYVAGAAEPYPPSCRGWSEADACDAAAVVFAEQLVPWFPVHHYADAMIASGLYRFYSYDSPHGRHVGALKWHGRDYQGPPAPRRSPGCARWVPDTSNPKTTTLANAILATSTPVAWAAGTTYDATIDGNVYRLVMWQGDAYGDGGTYQCISVFRCVPASSPGTMGAGSDSGGGGDAGDGGSTDQSGGAGDATGGTTDAGGSVQTDAPVGGGGGGGGTTPRPSAPAASTSSGSSSGVLFALVAAVAVAVGGWYTFAGRKAA